MINLIKSRHTGVYTEDLVFNHSEHATWILLFKCVTTTILAKKIKSWFVFKIQQNPQIYLNITYIHIKTKIFQGWQLIFIKF